MHAKNNSNELKITRMYDAPVKLVWDAWVDPAKAAKWWGPRGFTITTHSKDFRVGGHWSYTMHGPDGVNYENKTKYLEVEKYSRMVYDHGGNEDQDRPPLFRVTVTFKEVGAKTKMEMTMAWPTPEAAKEAAKFIKQASGNSTWDRLAEYLDKETQGKEKFVINRSFRAPIEKVFDLWTNPEHLAKWLPPTGVSMANVRPEIKVGGSLFFYMSNDMGLKFYGVFKYKEINRPNQIVYEHGFCDENEKMSRHPFMPMWPDTMLVTVRFAEEEGGTTRVTVESEAYGKFTADELLSFKDAKGSMTMGWTGSFDKLEEILER